jgi:hypothetical protein
VILPDLAIALAAGAEIGKKPVDLPVAGIRASWLTWDHTVENRHGTMLLPEGDRINQASGFQARIRAWGRSSGSDGPRPLTGL